MALLPNEIYLWILKKADNATVRACVVVSKEFYGIATEVLRQRKALRNVVVRAAARRRRKRLPYNRVPLAEMCPMRMDWVNACSYAPRLSLCVLASNPALLGARFIMRLRCISIPRFGDLLEDIVVHHDPGQADSIELQRNGFPCAAVEMTRLSPCATRLRPHYPMVFYPSYGYQITGVSQPYQYSCTMVNLEIRPCNYIGHNLNDGSAGSHKRVYEYLMSLCKD